MINTRQNKLLYKSPVKLLIIIASAVFVTEAVDMAVIYSLRPFPSDLIETLFDSTFLIVLLSPILYFFLFRPLLLHVEELNRAEEALQKAKEEEYKAILHTAMDGFWIVDTQGRIIDVNETYCRLTSYTRTELLRMSVSDVEAVETHEDTAQRIRDIIEKGYDRFETKHRCKDGKIIDIEVSVNYMRENGERFFVFLRNITERIKAEEALREAKNELEAKVADRTLELKSANEQLTVRAAELEQINREAHLLSKMEEFLQTCLTVEEAYSVIRQSLSQLLPEDSGALFIYNASRNLLNAATVWGDSPPQNLDFHPEECWALRQGRAYLTINTDINLMCNHISGQKDAFGFLCIPMSAQGETLGMLHLMIKLTDNVRIDNNWLKLKERLVTNVAEQVGLAITNLKLRETLRNLSIRDPLTGLFNRRYMEESLEREQSLAERRNNSFGIIMMDIDHFKRFNDTFGHEAGDTLLREFGTFLKKHIRASDIGCRYGGEEFTVIMPDASLETVRHRAEFLREGTQQMQILYNRELLGMITISLGIAVFPQHGSKAHAVLQAADSALYAAKVAGRDMVCVAGEKS